MRRNEDTRKLFDGLGDRPDYAPAYISRAFLERGSNADKAQADYERAHALDPKDWRTWYHLAGFYLDRGTKDRALDLAVNAYRQFPKEHAIKVLAARAYLNNGRYQDCSSVLANATILPFEGQNDIHTLFVECLVSQAMADMKAGRYSQAVAQLERSREYPERLGTGAPPNPDYRLQDYLEIFCYRESHQDSQASAAADRVRAFGHSENHEIQQKQVEDWYGTSFRTQPEFDALQSLTRLLRGSGGRRRAGE